MRTKLLFVVGIGLLAAGCAVDDGGGRVAASGTGTGTTTSAGAGGSGGASGTTGSGGGVSGTSGSSTAAATTGAAGSFGGGGSSGIGGSTASGGSSGAGGAIGTGGTGGSPSKDAGTDAAPPKDGGSDGPPTAGGPGCTGVTAKFCDDFEKQNATAPTGPFMVSGAGITVDSAKGSSGTKSLHWQPGTGTRAQLVFTTQFPFNDLHGRMMMFMAKTPTTGNHWDIVQSNNAGATQWEVGGQFGNFELVCDPPDHGLDSNTKFPEGKWVCIQWEFKFAGAGADNSFLTQVDGVPVEQGKFTGANSKGEKWVAGAWRDLHIGWEIFGGTTPVEFWIDDLAFGDQSIPCPTP